MLGFIDINIFQKLEAFFNQRHELLLQLVIRLMAFLNVFLPFSNSLKFLKFERVSVNNWLYLLKMLFSYWEHLCFLTSEKCLQISIEAFWLLPFLKAEIFRCEDRWLLNCIIRRLAGLWFKLTLLEPFCFSSALRWHLNTAVCLSCLRFEVPLGKLFLTKDGSFRLVTRILRIESIHFHILVTIDLSTAKMLVTLMVFWNCNTCLS